MFHNICVRVVNHCFYQVNKTSLEVRDDTTIAKILFRRHFSDAGKNFSPVLPSYTPAQSFPPTPKRSQVSQYVALVDPFGVGARIAYELAMQNIGVIGILSTDSDNVRKKVPESLIKSFTRILSLKDFGDHELSLDQLKSELTGLELPISAVMVGAETGVELGEKLSSGLRIKCNDSEHDLCRKNKYHVVETIRAAGLGAMRQIQATTWGEIATVLDEWVPEPFKVIAKPLYSAGSEDVRLCRNVEELQNAFGDIIGRVNRIGVVNETVLVQEFLSGEEFCIDMVSCNGEHKAVALWQCDKREVNGASCILFGQKVLSLSEEDGGVYNEIISYQKSVLDSLGILNGPTHAKIMWHNDEPILIEVGCHCHGREGQWVDLAVSIRILF